MDSSSDTDEECNVFKVVLLGNGSVGKTTLIQSFCKNADSNGGAHSSHAYKSSSSPAAAATTNTGSFDANGNWRGKYKQTVGVDFYSKRIELPSSFRQDGHDGAVVLHLWDVGGQQIGGTMLGTYIHDADAICLVYDVTNTNSFKDLEDWLVCVRRQLNSGNRQPSSIETASTYSEGFSASGKHISPMSGATPTRVDGMTPVSSELNDSTNGTLASVLSSVIRKPDQRGSSLLGQRHPRGQPLMALVATKMDSPINTHAISDAAHDAFVQQNSFDESFHVSSRTGDWVSALFLKLTADLMGHEVRPQDLKDFGFAVTNISSTSKERQPAAEQLFAGQGGAASIKMGGASDPRLAINTRPDDCVIM